jgi:transposase
VLRQPHRAGEKCFVDFCDGLPLYDEHTGERIATELFVGALGASSYTFAWATLSQNLPTWLDCHVRMYEFFCGVSAITVPDFVPGNKIGLMCPSSLCGTCRLTS